MTPLEMVLKRIKPTEKWFSINFFPLTNQFLTIVAVFETLAPTRNVRGWLMTARIHFRDYIYLHKCLKQGLSIKKSKNDQATKHDSITKGTCS
jgi:hypothetical protein